MSINLSDDVTSTSAVTELIELTQKGLLTWAHGNQEDYVANLKGKEFRLTLGLEPSESGVNRLSFRFPFSSSSSGIPYQPNSQIVRLDVYDIYGKLDFRFPSIPALNGLAIAVEQYVSGKTSEVYALIHDALERDQTS